MSSVAYQPLVPLLAIKGWLAALDGKTYPPSSDPLIQSLIGAASGFVVSYLQRPIIPATFTDVYNGNGTRQLRLRKTPIVQVRSLTIQTTSIQPRPAVGQAGYVADDTALYLDGGGCLGFGPFGHFVEGVQNVSVTYDAGYQFAETWTVPVAPTSPSGPPQIDSGDLQRVWNADRGVTYASSGAALTTVATTPTVTGTYQVATDENGSPVYYFAPGDVGTSLVITYGFTPEPIAQAVIELVGERMKAATRIGEVSKSIPASGANYSYSQKDMNATIKTMLAPFRQVVPA